MGICARSSVAIAGWFGVIHARRRSKCANFMRMNIRLNYKGSLSNLNPSTPIVRARSRSIVTVGWKPMLKPGMKIMDVRAGSGEGGLCVAGVGLRRFRF